MGFSKSRVSDKDQALLLLDVLAARQVEDLGFVKQGQVREIEIGEFFEHGETRQLDALLQHILLALIDFLFGQRQ